MVTTAGARRELEDLRSAINHHRTEGLCSEVVGVALPEKSDPREDWLTRSEAARLIWAAWRARQKMGEGITDRDVGRHLARFVLVGIYTGTRHGAICSPALIPAVGRGYVDTDSGAFYRRRQGSRQTNKRQAGSAANAPEALETARHRPSRRCRVERQAGCVGSEVICFGGADGGYRSPHYPAHLPAHRGDLGNAARVGRVGCCRVSRHEPGGFGARLRSSSSRFSKRRCRENVGTEPGQKPREQTGTERDDRDEKGQ